MLKAIDTPNIYENIPPKSELRAILGERMPRNPPEWFFHAESPLTFDIWVSKETPEFTNIEVGNTGFSISMITKEEELTHHFKPNLSIKPDDTNPLGYSGLYIVALRKFIEWWQRQPADSKLRQKEVITGSTNRTMFEFRKKFLDLLGPEIISAYFDRYDKEFVYYIDIEKLIKAFENITDAKVLRLLKIGESMEGVTSMVNPVLYNYLATNFIKDGKD